jgi:Glycosyltransferase family 87
VNALRDLARRGTLTRGEGWAVLAALAGLVLVNVPLHGADPWDFEPGEIGSRGALGVVVDLVGNEWDPEALRSGALVGLLLVAAVASASLARRRWSPVALGALAVAVLALLVLPGVFLQAALRDSTERWFFVNDSTYQMELSGELLREGENPYGHDYRFSGLERFYSLDGTVTDETRDEQPALRHFLYFPGPALTAAVWTALPRPWDDYRFLIALTTLASFAAALAFRAPLAWRLVAGAFVAGNPLAVRAAWFGNADVTSYVLLLLALAFVTRARYVAAGALLGGAIVLKQFALLALPFFLVMVLTRAGRDVALRAGGACLAVVAVCFLPFLVWDPGAFLDDTIPVGQEMYRIVGPGLASALVELGVIDGRRDPYPFLPLVLLIWLPLTAWLVWSQSRSRALWTGAVGLAVSLLVFIVLSRVFQPSFLVWPLVALVAAALLARGEREPSSQPR